MSQHGFGLSPFYDHNPFKVSCGQFGVALEACLIEPAISVMIEVGPVRATRTGPSSVALPNRRLPGGALRRYKRSEPEFCGFDRATVAQLSRRSR